MKRLISFYSFLLLLAGPSCTDIIEVDISGEEIELVAPLNQFTSNSRTVNFFWNPIDGATEYNLQVVSPSYDSIAQVVVDSFTFDNNLTLTLNPGNYEWSVLGINSAYSSRCCEIRSFEIADSTIEDISNLTLPLTLPSDSACLPDTLVSLEWAGPNQANDLYRIQISQEENFNILLSERTTENNAIIAQLNEEGSYFWRVRLERGSNNTFSNWNTRTFTVDITPPNAPIAISPADGDTLVAESNPGLFLWDSTDDSIFDSLYIYKDILLEELASGQESNTESATDTVLTSLEKNKVYFWQVKSFDKAGNISLGSDVKSFFLKP